jgi:DNA polymerase III subunit delta'
MSDDNPAVLDGAMPVEENTALFGHEKAEAFLAESYRSGKGHHAILLEGPEGIGKATLAFRFANHVLSHPDPLQAPETMQEPDPQSMHFRQIAAGASHNLLHLTRPVDEKTGKQKGAITVDEVRRGSKFFSQTSGTGNWRIVIVDPADDLNRNAANAILKILEEPPKRAMFLVLSHAPGKLLPTIRSRCLSLRLSPLSDTALLAALGHLGQEIPPETRQIILSSAKGSVSEALKLINYGGLEIMTVFADVLQKSGASARKDMHRLADALSSKDSETIFTFFINQLTARVESSAKAEALGGHFAKAERLARLSVDIVERLNIAQAYNLDRKQALLTVLAELKEAI